MDKRKLKILSCIIELYIATGEPVGSNTVTKYLDGNISSATVRNEMVALTEMGFLEQPHTSAGRIPSYLGYRLYIDELMSKKPLTEEDKHTAEQLYELREPDPQKLLEEAGALLADYTGYVAISSTPCIVGCRIARIELIPASRRSILLVVVTSASVTKNRLCRLDFEVSADQLTSLHNFLKEKLTGRDVSDITTAFIQTLAASMGENSFIFSPVFLGVYEIAAELDGVDIKLEGQMNILGHAELISAAKDIFSFLTDTGRLARIVEQGGQGVKVLLGTELEEVLLPSGLILTSYETDSLIKGSLGLMGPVRMDYAKLVPFLEYYSNILGKLIADIINDNS